MADSKHVAVLKQGVTVWNEWRDKNPNIVPDLHRASLSEIDLGARTLGANLTKANLTKANLTKADLTKADLTKARLSYANLTEATLIAAQLDNAILIGSVLREADLTMANLTRAQTALLPPPTHDGADWREANLRGASLIAADLRGVDLRGADLGDTPFPGRLLGDPDVKVASSPVYVADLRGADLRGADLRGADLRGARLSGVHPNWDRYLIRSYTTTDGRKQPHERGYRFTDAEGRELDATLWRIVRLEGVMLLSKILARRILSRTNLEGVNLSGAVVDEQTLKRTFWLKNAHKGVNGIWVKSTDSTALVTLTPPGNSMHAPNVDAVVESLKHARRLHGISFGIALLGLGILLQQGVETFSITTFPDLKFSIEHFAFLGMAISIGLLSLVKSFMNDALSGARYLRTRNDAMTVGTFPWALSRYTGQRWDSMLQSYVTRFVMAYHPFAYAAFWDLPVPWYYWGLAGTLLLFCTWIFIISQQFQRPILFDRRTEENRKSDLEKQTEAVKQQTATMEEVAALFKSKEPNTEDDDAV